MIPRAGTTMSTTRATARGRIHPLRASLGFLRDPFGSLERTRQRGELVRTRVLGWRVAIVTAPALAHEVLTGPIEVWHEDRVTRRTGGVLGEGLLLAEDEVWRRQRSMLDPGFRHARHEAYARNGAGGDDLLALLLEARDHAGSGLRDREVRDRVMTFLLAGHETTALLLVSALVLLGMHPAERVRVEAEVDALGRPPQPGDPLPRVEAVIAESLHLRPPAWLLSREPTRDVVGGGHRLEAGTIVVISPWPLHHDPRSWGPDAAAFRPDRFAERTPPKGAYVPFGLGGRKCIGAKLAEMEARLLLARWAQAVRLEPEPPRLPKLVPSITARPAGPVWARVRRRRDAQGA